MSRKLKYIGSVDANGQPTAFLPGVPASDHTCEDDEARERVKSGLYEDVTPKKEKPDE